MADLCATPLCEQLQLAQAVEINHIVEIIPTGPNPLLVPLLDEDVLKKANDKIEVVISDIKSKIHRFPANLREYGTKRDYMAPWIVAIGPYYHKEPKLQAMEEVKRMAAYCFCEGLADYTPKEVYEKILAVTCKARGCYADADALKSFTNDDFADMMFLDGCFLVQCMVSEISEDQSLLSSVIDWKGRGNILRDIMLLENQIPWLVLQELTALISPSPIGRFIVHCRSLLRVRQGLKIDEDSKPLHLLGLMHFSQVHSSIVEKESMHEHNSTEKEERAYTTSAAELAEIGIKLTSSGTTQFSEMEVVRGHLFGKLSLAPLTLDDDVTACVLVNMAAFEQCLGIIGNFDHPVNSYLAVLAQLMQRDDDVHELRGKGIVHTTFDYHQTLDFFNSLVPHLRPDDSYFLLLQGIEEYKEKRRVCIAIHKFLYNNAKTIATVLSIAGVLVGIFQALLSLKKHQP